MKGEKRLSPIVTSPVFTSPSQNPLKIYRDRISTKMDGCSCLGYSLVLRTEQNAPSGAVMTTRLVRSS